MGTKFSTVYNHFLGQITDDLYLELTPVETIRDLQTFLIKAIPGFEFPRKNLYNYESLIVIKNEDELQDSDFVLGLVWGEIPEDIDEPQKVYVDESSFEADLTLEEIDILSILMMIGWIQRQVSSIEVTRMKYSGTD